MANGSSSRRGVGDEKNNAAKRRHNTIKGSKVSSTVTVDKSGLKKSESEDFSKKKTVTRSLSTRKSERIENQTPPTPFVKRKSAIKEKQQTPSSLRRSERGKKQLPSASSGLKKSDGGPSSPDIKHRQERKEKRAKKLESEQISRSAENNLETGPIKGSDSINKRAELKTGNNDGRASRRTNNVSKCMLEVIDNNHVAELSCASQNHILGDETSEHEDGNSHRLCQSHCSTYASSEAMAKQTTNERESAHLEFSEKDIQIAVCIATNSPLTISSGDQIDLEKNCEILPLKRKRNDADTYFGDSEVVGRTIDCSSTAEILSPPSSFCLQSRPVEKCDVCFKRQRSAHTQTNSCLPLC